MPKLDQEGNRKFQRSNTSKEMELVSTNLPSKKNLGPSDFTDISYWTFKELIRILLKVFPKSPKGGNTLRVTLQNLPYPETKASKGYH